MKNKLHSFLLWWAVIGYSLWIGGTFFSMVVIVPMWNYDPPASVVFFFSETKFNTTIYNFFGPPWMAARIVPLLLAVFTAAPGQRRWLLASAACMIIMIVFTLVFVYPINTILMTHAGAGKTAKEVTALAETWVLADRIRFIVGCIGYIAILYAFQKNPAHVKTLHVQNGNNQ